MVGQKLGIQAVCIGGDAVIIKCVMISRPFRTGFETLDPCIDLFGRQVETSLRLINDAIVVVRKVQSTVLAEKNLTGVKIDDRLHFMWWKGHGSIISQRDKLGQV